MEIDNNWYNDIVKEIDKHKGRFTKKDYKKYKLDLLLRVAKRATSFSIDCSECQNFQIEIKNLAEHLGNLIQSPKEERKIYFRTIDDIIKHLQKHHKLIVEEENIGIWMVIGIVIGVALGSLLDNTGGGIGIGIVVGAAIGAYLDDKAKKDGKVI
jgi:hypothetical protein